MTDKRDEFHGVGGSYVFDPKSKKRIPAKDYRPDDPAPAAADNKSQGGGPRRSPGGAAASGD